MRESSNQVLFWGKAGCMARFGFANKKYGKQDPNLPKHSRNFNPYLIVGLSAILCYLNSLFGEFVYDDYEVIETNADVR